MGGVFGNGTGDSVRYVKIVLPRGSVTRDGVLEEIRFLYGSGADDDDPYNP
jgi:hypothetical protein